MRTSRLFVRTALQVVLIAIVALAIPLAPTQASLSAAPGEPDQPTQVGLIPDTAGIGDMSFNWLAYQGLLRAEDQLVVVGAVYTTTDPGDFELQLQQCVNDGNDLCVSVGFLMQEATWNVAQANPGTDFAIVDAEYGDYLPNLRGITFAEEEGAYLAGTLAGLMTDSDILGEIGGMDIPPVNRFLYGFQNGAQCANLTATAIISYTYDFGNPGLGAQVAQELMAQGADTIFVAAGATGNGAVLTATQSGAWGIGVDVDYYVTVFQSGTVAGSDLVLTSALKKVDNVVFATIEDVVNDQFTSGTMRYNLAMDGVGIAPYHETDPLIPQAVKDQVEVVRQGIISGTVDPWYTCRVMTRYVDGATGSDDSDCSDPNAPCQTIQYTVDQAGDSDDILVAQGTYTENVTLHKRVFLRGGYSGLPDWTRDLALYPTTIHAADGPVEGDWDGESVYGPTVIDDSGTLKMWYGGQSQWNPTRIGYAESTNGIDWTRPLTQAVLFEGNPGEWDEREIGQPSVIEQGGLYQMWYFGGNNDQINQIGYATSTNGIDWIKYAGNPVLTIGDPGQWDETEVGGPRVLYDGTTYHMWYHGFSGACCDSIGYATSTDGINWTKYAGNPVFGPGDPGQWDEGFVFFSAVITDSGQLHMWYSTAFKPFGVGIGYVTSTDGISWTRFLSAPVVTVGDPGTWDEHYVFAPTVLENQNTYHMWYTGSPGGPSSFGYATSPDGISWTKSISNPVFSPGEPGQWGTPVIAFEAGSDGAILDGFTITGAQVGQEGAITVYGTAPIIQSCLVQGNTADGRDEWGAGGIVIEPNSAPIISQTIVVSNSVAGGASGIRIGHASMTLINSLIAGNAGRPAIHANSASMVLTNVTIADNNDVGVLLANSQATVLNSIIWEVGNPDLETPEGGLYTVDYSDLEDGVITGTGNISADPLFVGGGDYHLGDTSPCIDVGTTAGAPTYDWEGDVRPFGYEVDMGADEWLGELGAGLLAMTPGGSGAPGTTAIYTFTITNEGNYTDTFQLAAGGVWTPTLSTNTADPLAPGEVFTFTLDVAIPDGAAPGDEDVTTVTATSSWDPEVWATAQVTTTAAGGGEAYAVYLPVVFK